MSRCVCRLVFTALALFSGSRFHFDRSSISARLATGTGTCRCAVRGEGTVSTKVSNGLCETLPRAFTCSTKPDLSLMYVCVCVFGGEGRGWDGRLRHLSLHVWTFSVNLWERFSECHALMEEVITSQRAESAFGRVTTPYWRSREPPKKWQGALLQCGALTSRLMPTARVTDRCHSGRSCYNRSAAGVA